MKKVTYEEWLKNAEEFFNSPVEVMLGNEEQTYTVYIKDTDTMETLLFNNMSADDMCIVTDIMLRYGMEVSVRKAVE